MPARVTHVLNEKQLLYIFNSPQGAVARDLMKRGARVESRAKRNLGGGTGSGPKRVDTGLLRSSINKQLIQTPLGMAVRVGTNVYYARWVHDGTGIYGPKKMKIVPKRARALVFRSIVYGAKKGKWRGKVVVSSVKGMRGNPFLEEALPAFKI